MVCTLCIRPMFICHSRMRTSRITYSTVQNHSLSPFVFQMVRRFWKEIHDICVTHKRIKVKFVRQLSRFQQNYENDAIDHSKAYQRESRGEKDAKNFIDKIRIDKYSTDSSSSSPGMIYYALF